jgi:hypothetical protein
VSKITISEQFLRNCPDDGDAPPAQQHVGGDGADIDGRSVRPNEWQRETIELDSQALHSGHYSTVCDTIGEALRRLTSRV